MDRMPLSECRMRPFLLYMISFYLVVDYDDLGNGDCISHHFQDLSN